LPAKREAPNAPESLLEVTEPPPAAEAAPKLDTIDDEMSMLGSAHASLRAGRPSEALAQLAEHKRRFPTSKLAESREVARIIALCQAGQRKTARAAAERFLATHSGSPLANRVRTVCADTGEK
jgi:outer membrane protein assembly factor BamD (BamD/ComL family)